jgi:hypothetical protein
MDFQDVRDLLDQHHWMIVVAGPSKYRAWPMGHEEQSQIFFTLEAAVRFVTGK